MSNSVAKGFIYQFRYFERYCIKVNVNVCLIFPNLSNGFETGTIKTLSLIIFVGMVGQDDARIQIE